MNGVELTHARVVETLVKLRLGHIAERLDAHLSDGAREDLTYLDFLDRLLGEEVRRLAKIKFHFLGVRSFTTGIRFSAWTRPLSRSSRRSMQLSETA